MLVYDVTNEKSFENIKNWIRNIEENASADVEKMLLGNKCELTSKRQVSRERGEALAVEYSIKFIETSAKSSINVEEAFFTLARDIKAKMEKKLVRFLFYCTFTCYSFFHMWNSICIWKSLFLLYKFKNRSKNLKLLVKIYTQKSDHNEIFKKNIIIYGYNSWKFRKKIGNTKKY